jgi:hypothetical protein
VDLATAHTSPEDRGKCGFCDKEENGYAKKDENGKWQASCWKYVKPEHVGASQAKRETVGTVFTDVEPEEEKPRAKKSPGMAPSTHRPKVL